MKTSHKNSLSQKRLARKENTRPIKQRFLIVCEGTETEKNYFNAFPISSKNVVVVGVGQDPSKVVARAIKEKDKDPDIDQVWCVFDRDEWTTSNFINAIQAAQSHGIRVAYSNEAFEVWYLLHFHYYNNEIKRAEYAEMLTRLLGESYRKNCQNMYKKLLPKQEQAIAHANRLLKSYGDQHSPDRDNPSTTVHLLVQELNKYL